MKEIWKVWISSRRSIYLKIARKYHTTAWRVYRLGHGGRSRSTKEDLILEELKRYGIISRIQY